MVYPRFDSVPGIPSLTIKLIKFADNTTHIGLISYTNEYAYRSEVACLASWRTENNLELNIPKNNNNNSIGGDWFCWKSMSPSPHRNQQACNHHLHPQRPQMGNKHNSYNHKQCDMFICRPFFLQNTHTHTFRLYNKLTKCLSCKRRQKTHLQ